MIRGIKNLFIRYRFMLYLLMSRLALGGRGILPALIRDEQARMYWVNK